MKPKKSVRPRPAVNNTIPQRLRGSGFTGLEPSTMGFSMPEWMEPSPQARPADEACSKPATTAAPNAEPERRSMVEGMKVVCICKGIKKRVFWNALDAGMCTHEEINRHTGSGSGSCQGRRCGPRILDMLKRRR